MTGHVTYMCHCLNIGIHIANKYYIDGHEKYKGEKFVTLDEDPTILGWKFELDNKKGVTVKYSSFVSASRTKDSTSNWITFKCHNCNSGDVYSVKRPNADLSYPIDTSIMSQPGDKVIIHKGAIFGEDIDKLRKNTAYSHIFQIILNPDLPVNYTNIDKDKDDSFGTELLAQQKHVQQLLRQSLIELEDTVEKRIQIYRQEQETLLNREKEKAKYDGAVLWQSMKEVSKTIHDEVKYMKKRLSVNNKQNGATSDYATFNSIVQNEEQEHTIRDLPEDPLEHEMSKGESHVQFSHNNNSNDFASHHNQHRRRSSAFRRDLFGGYTVPSNSHRRSSYVLDESAIAKSFNKKDHPLVETAVNGLPPFQRSSSLTPSSSVHPLSAASTQQQAQEINIMTLSSNSPSFFEEEMERDKPELKADAESDEDMFALDEDMEKPYEDDNDDDLLMAEERRFSSRKPSTKYIKEEDIFDDDMDDLRPIRIEETNFATSVPITITHPPASVNTEIYPATNNNVQHLYPSSNSFIESTEFNHHKRTRQKSFVGFDYAEADRRASSLLPPMENNHHHNIRYRRKSSSAISVKNKSHNNHPSHAPFFSGSNNKINLMNFNEEDDDEGGGPMIPPHILAANTVTDETEAIFGSVPRNSIRHRPLE